MVVLYSALFECECVFVFMCVVCTVHVWYKLVFCIHVAFTEHLEIVKSFVLHIRLVFYVEVVLHKSCICDSQTENNVAGFFLSESEVVTV